MACPCAAERSRRPWPLAWQPLALIGHPLFLRFQHQETARVSVALPLPRARAVTGLALPASLRFEWDGTRAQNRF